MHEAEQHSALDSQCPTYMARCQMPLPSEHSLPNVATKNVPDRIFG